MGERRFDAVVLGPGAPGLLKVSLVRGRGQFVADVPFDTLPPSLRLPNAQFVAVVEGRTFLRVDPSGRAWITIQDQIRSVLNREWDPIRVADCVDDEYDGYIGAIYSLVRKNASEQKIAEHLLLIERQMGLQGRPIDRLLQVAAKLRELRLPSLEKQGGLLP